MIVCERKDRLTRVGFNYLKVLLTQTNRDIEVVNLASEETNDLMDDFVSMQHIFLGLALWNQNQNKENRTDSYNCFN